jgi:hypothetical protein
MSQRPLWEQLYRRFDPEESVPVDHPSWRAERPHTALGGILELLATPFVEARILFMGTVGTGKTTELLRLAEARAQDDFVVFLDLAGHFDKVVGNPAALQRVSSWEVCFLVGLAVYRMASERLQIEWPSDVLPNLAAAWSAVAKASRTPSPAHPDLELGKLARAMVVLGAALVPGGGAVAAGLQALGAAAESLKWSLPLGQSKDPLPDDDEQVRTLLSSVNRIIGEVQLRHGRPLIVVDGLDRIRDVTAARSLFVESDLLGRLACPIVLCGPFALRHHLDVSTVRRFHIFSLMNEPVLRQRDPVAQGEGVAFFWDVFRRRVEDIGAMGLISHEQILRLAYYSGGRARDFVRLIRNLALKAWQADTESATAAQLDAVIDDARRLLETGIHTGHIDLLRQVMADPDHRLPEDELVWELLTSSRLLPYPNESEWFYPHPLLTMHLVRPAGSTK